MSSPGTTLARMESTRLFEVALGLEAPWHVVDVSFDPPKAGGKRGVLRLRLDFDAEARLLACDMDYAIDNGAFPHFPDNTISAAMFMWGAYKIPRFSYAMKGYHTNTVGLGGYRGPWAIETLARETRPLDTDARSAGPAPPTK